jgi:hypothetical protein
MKETRSGETRGMLLWTTTGFSGGKKDQGVLLRSVWSSKINKCKTARMGHKRLYKKNKNNPTRKTGEEINTSSN